MLKMESKRPTLSAATANDSRAMSGATSRRTPTMRVGFQGDHGAYAENAIGQIWSTPLESVPFRTFTAAMRAVSEREIEACVIPIENSLIGRVDAGWDAIAAFPGCRRVAEALVPVNHCLLALPGATLHGLKVAASQPVALEQCTKFFAAHEWIEPRKSFDTAGSAREVAESGDLTRAAIASQNAGSRYGLSVLAEGIQDHPRNHTRFVAIVSEQSTLWRRTHSIRGAISVAGNDAVQIAAATRELLTEIIERNSLRSDEVISVLFSATPDLDAAFPAKAARDLGWVEVPLLCMSEIAVPGSMPRCLRVLLQVELRAPRVLDTHVYLRDAVALRPDLPPMR
jgi:monofunctional chorismate mutase